jgi:hypothetical protein
MYSEEELESNRGWNQASIVFWSRKPYRPNIKAEDFQLPSGVGSLRMLVMCAFMATSLTVLYL